MKILDLKTVKTNQQFIMETKSGKQFLYEFIGKVKSAEDKFSKDSNSIGRYVVKKVEDETITLVLEGWFNNPTRKSYLNGTSSTDSDRSRFMIVGAINGNNVKCISKFKSYLKAHEGFSRLIQNEGFTSPTDYSLGIELLEVVYND